MFLYISFLFIEKDNSYGHKVTSVKTCSLISTQEGSPFLKASKKEELYMKI